MTRAIAILAGVLALAACGGERCASSLRCDAKVKDLAQADQQHLCAWGSERLQRRFAAMEPCGELKMWPQVHTNEVCVAMMQRDDGTVRDYEEDLQRILADPCRTRGAPP